MAGAVSLAAAARGAAVAWVVPTYKNGRPLWRFIERSVAHIKRVHANKSERVASFPGGGFVGVYSADNPDSILGEAFDLVVVDEAARIDEGVWTETLMPTLADRNGRAMLISTPRGRNWFWQEYIKADGDRVAAFNAPSSDNPNPNIQRAAMEAKNRVPERIYRQEWLADFVEMEGAVFRNVSACVRDDTPQEPQDNHAYIFGIDIGRVNDYTVCVVLDATTNNVVAIDRYTGVSFAAQEQRIIAMHNVWMPVVMIVEINNFGMPFVESLVRQNLPVRPFKTTATTKNHIIDKLAFAFEHRSLTIPNDQTLLNELIAYHSTQLPSGLLRYSAPDGQHDDCVMALAFAWYAAEGQ
jgi:phage terminase large subunit-like protein